jgi:hypothetical protein
MRKPMIPTLALLAGAALFALTGCTGPAESTAGPSPSNSASSEPTTESTEPAAEGQSVEEACLIANETILSVQGDVNAAMANPDDPAAVTAALETIEARLGDAVAEISNAEVGAALGAFQAQFASFTDQLVAVQAGTPTQEQVAAIQTAAADLQTSAEGMRELCT